MAAFSVPQMPGRGLDEFRCKDEDEAGKFWLELNV
jgi:hypothetical protein